MLITKKYYECNGVEIFKNTPLNTPLKIFKQWGAPGALALDPPLVLHAELIAIDITLILELI